MEKRIFYAPVNHPRCGDDLEHPWKYAVPAYRVTPHVWNVGGQDDVCAYLFDTGEGLLLIDTGYRASLYLLVDAIRSLGYDPRDIKKILLSHWHWDHVNGCAALQAMSGAEVWISREDEVFHQRFKDDTSELPMVDYTATRFYDDDAPITLGRFTIRTTLTPGHTPGATSFRWEDTDETTGRTYRCGDALPLRRKTGGGPPLRGRLRGQAGPLAGGHRRPQPPQPGQCAGQPAPGPERLLRLGGRLRLAGLHAGPGRGREADVP